MKPLAAGALAAVLLLAGRPAAAQPVADSLPPGPWYGWQVMLTDAAAVTLLFAPVSDSLGPLARGMGMTALLMGPAIVHMSHRNPGSAAVTLLRVPFLLLGRMLAGLTAQLACTSLSCLHDAPTVGSAIGVAPVMVYDWVYARRPPRLFYAGGGAVSRAPPLRRFEGWTPSIALIAGRF
jgi:hypothetical protein